MSASATKTGTCPVCGQSVAIVNYDRVAILSDPLLPGGHYEVGYLGRHGRPGVRAGAKCRGSFGSWMERKR
jgi:hypothetical protein